MSTRSWTRLKADAVAKLTQACPELERHASMLMALAAVTALVEVKLSVRTIAGRLDADVRTSPSVAGDPLAKELVGLISDMTTHCATSARPQSGPAFGDWIEGHGFSDMSVALLTSDADWKDLSAVARIVAGAVKTLSERSSGLGHKHVERILARDLPQAQVLRNSLTSVAVWLLAPEDSGKPHRPTVIVRRLQAMTVYGSLSGTLRDDAVTAAIDAGLQLAPILMKCLDLSAAELRALRNGRTLRHAIEASTDFRAAVEELKVHGVPLHEWPGGGRPDQARAWESSVWARGSRQHFVRPDYLDPCKDAVTDAINALRADLLGPLVVERVRLGGHTPSYITTNFARSIEIDAWKDGSVARRRLVGALRNAIVGPRRAKAFHEAVGLWHRRVASLSALRHERRVERPGWPALCAPWQSECGRYEIVVLASAEDLVEEGRILDHCVGGYYDICRHGDTQILSLREDGKRVATVELKLAPDLKALVLEVGQFKSHRNSRPPVHLHDPLRAFLKDVRNGSHPVDARTLARYRKAMRDVWDGAWSSETLSLEHAREVFPFYLPLLPRGTPASFDGWCETTGLAAAIDATLAYLEA